MKYLLTTIISLLFLMPLQAKGPAGTVLYFRNAQSVYILLADDINSNRGWSSFGGGAEEGESEMETAARETEEETRGFFIKEWLLQKMHGQKPIKFKGFSMYFVEVPFVPAQQIMNTPLKKNASESMRERVHYAWIPETDLKRALTVTNAKIDSVYLPTTSKSKLYWNIWLAGMENAYKKNACPWLKPKKANK